MLHCIININYISFRNKNTGKIEVGLIEEMYEDQENTDKLERLKSASNAPYLISVAFVREEVEDTVLLDCDDLEI